MKRHRHTATVLRRDRHPRRRIEIGLPQSLRLTWEASGGVDRSERDEAGGGAVARSGERAHRERYRARGAAVHAGHRPGEAPRVAQRIEVERRVRVRAPNAARVARWRRRGREARRSGGEVPRVASSSVDRFGRSRPLPHLERRRTHRAAGIAYKVDQRSRWRLLVAVRELQNDAWARLLWPPNRLSDVRFPQRHHVARHRCICRRRALLPRQGRESWIHAAVVGRCLAHGEVGNPPRLLQRAIKHPRVMKCVKVVHHPRSYGIVRGARLVAAAHRRREHKGQPPGCRSHDMRKSLTRTEEPLNHNVRRGDDMGSSPPH